MFGRDRAAEVEDHAADPMVHVAPSVPAMTAEQRMRRFFNTPSNLASRKAEREAAGIPARPAPQLVSDGITEHVQRKPRQGSRHIPGDDVEVIEVELYHERQHTARRYYRYVGDTTIYPLFDTSTEPIHTVQPLGTVQAAGFSSGIHSAGRPDDVSPV